MSISPPPFSPARSQSDGDESEFVDDDNDQPIQPARTLVSTFDLYKTAIDQLRSTIKSSSTSEQRKSLEDFKPLTTRTNAWIYIRIHDDLIHLLITYLKHEELSIQSVALSILANIACDQASHEQIFETDLINLICQKLSQTDQIDLKNRCFRLLGNVCSIEEAARKMINANLAQNMGDVLRTCTDSACLHSTIRCSRKLSIYKVCRDPMLDSMCLLSICKQLFTSKAPLRKEAMKAVLEWNSNNCDRSRSQLREGEIFRFLISTIESKTDKEYRHISLRLLDDLLRHGDMRSEFGHRQGLDFLVKMIRTKQYQSNYEHFKFLGLFCVCCQDVSNRRYIKEDLDKMALIFEYLEKYQYRSNFLDLLLMAIGQFLYDEQSLLLFVRQMQMIERLCNLFESVVLVKYEISQKSSNDRKRIKTEHQNKERIPMMIDLNEILFTEFVENPTIDEERPTCTTNQTLNIEKRRRTESLILILLSKISYETTETNLRRYIYNRRLVSLLLRYINSSDEPNPRSVRILHRLTKQIDCGEFCASLSFPYLLEKYFHLERSKDESTGNDDYLFDVLIHDNRAFFQRLSWTDEKKRLKTIENRLMKNLEQLFNNSFVFNEVLRQLNDSQNNEKFSILLSLIPTIKQNNFSVIFPDRRSNHIHLVEPSDGEASIWVLKIFFSRLKTSKQIDHLQDFSRLLKVHSKTSIIEEEKLVELNLNNEHSVEVNTILLSQHSDYFRSLFIRPFIESQQKKVFIQLPETVNVKSFEHLIKILSNSDEFIQSERLNDLFVLCDVYLFEFLPFRLVSFALDQFIQGNFIQTIDIASKPNLLSSLIFAYFSYLFNHQTNLSTEIFLKLFRIYPDQLRTFIRITLQQKSWFHDENSPFR